MVSFSSLLHGSSTQPLLAANNLEAAGSAEAQTPQEIPQVDGKKGDPDHLPGFSTQKAGSVATQRTA